MISNEPFYLSHNNGETDVNPSGTFLIGNVKTTYQKLVDRFGPPMRGGDKTTCEWWIELPEIKRIATIYDWKTGSTPMGEYNWHIGSNKHDRDIIRSIESILED